jgi:hypothetical protein
MADDTAHEILRDFRARGLEPKLQAAAQRVYTMLKRDQKRRLAAGLISQQTYDYNDQLFSYYVPLRGSAEREDQVDGGRTGRGYDTRGTDNPTALGRLSLPSNPLHTSILMAEEGIVRSEKNRVGKKLLTLAQTNPNPDVWTVVKGTARAVVDPFTGLRRGLPPALPPTRRTLDANGQVINVPNNFAALDEKVLVVKVGGQPYFLELRHPGLAEAFKNLGASLFEKAFFRNWAGLMRLFSQLQTGRNPEFFIANASRDVQEAVSKLVGENSGLVAPFLRNWTQAMAVAGAKTKGKTTTARWDALFEEWRNAGGKISNYAFRDLDALHKEIEASLNPKTGVYQATKSTFKWALKQIDDMNETFESATRLAVYAAAREKGYSVAKAAALSLEATVNFTKKGRWSGYVNLLYAFYNASIQGNVSALKLLRRSHRAKILYLSMIPMGIIASAVQNAVWGDDDDPEKRSLYSKIPEWERRQNLIIIYGTKKKGDRTHARYIKIPLAFGLRVPYYLGEQMAQVWNNQIEPGKAAWNVLLGTLDAFNPIGQGSLAQVIAPTLVDPITDMWANRNWLGRPIVPDEQRWNKGLPHASQAFSTTSPAAVMVAEAINNATGGDTALLKKGLIDLYPGHIEYAAGFVTGGAGRFVGNLWGAGMDIASGISTPLERTPIIRRFLGQTGPAAESARFYEVRDEVEEKRNRLRTLNSRVLANPDDEAALIAREELAGELGAKIGGKTKNGQPRKTIDWQSAVTVPFDEAAKEIKELRTEQHALRTDKSKTRFERHEANEERELRLEDLMRNKRRDYFEMAHPR